MATKGLLYLNLDGRYPGGFSIFEPRAIERLLYPNLKL